MDVILTPSAIVVCGNLQALAFAIIIFSACGGTNDWYLRLSTNWSFSPREDSLYKELKIKIWATITKSSKQVKMVNRIFSKKTFQERQSLT